MSGSVGQENCGQAATPLDPEFSFTAQRGGSVVGSSSFASSKSTSTPTPFPASTPAPPLSSLPPWTGRTMFTSTMNPFPPCTFSPQSTPTLTTTTKTASVFTSYAGAGGSFLTTPTKSSSSLSTSIKSPRSPPIFTMPDAYMPRTTRGTGPAVSSLFPPGEDITDVDRHAAASGQSGIPPVKADPTETGTNSVTTPLTPISSSNQDAHNHLPIALTETFYPYSTTKTLPNHTVAPCMASTATPCPNALTPIPDELMILIYSYCPRSTLLNCMLVDRRQFSLVIPIAWRIVRSPETNLKQLRGLGSRARGSENDPEGHWGHARSRVYLAAIRNYVTTSRSHFSERFNVQEELPFLSDQCPDIRRVEIAYGNVIRLVLHRQAGTSEWTDLEMIVTNVTKFMQAEDDQSYASWFSEMLWPWQISEGRTALSGLRLIRLAVEDSMDHHHRFAYFLDWIRPYTRHLGTLEIGPELCGLAEDRMVDNVILLLQLRPSIHKLHLCGTTTSALVARIINTSTSNLEELALCAYLPSYVFEHSDDYDDEENSQYQSSLRSRSITDKHPELVRSIDAIDRLKRLVLYVNPGEINWQLGRFKNEKREHAPTDCLDIFPVPKSCPISLAHIDDIVFGKDPYHPFPHQKWHDQWLKDMEEALREKRENSR